VELWSRERGLERISAAYPLSFYMHLKDPHAHWEMIEALESRYRVEACSFNSIFGTFEGHRIFASRKVAEKVRMAREPKSRTLEIVVAMITPPFLSKSPPILWTIPSSGPLPTSCEARPPLPTQRFQTSWQAQRCHPRVRQQGQGCLGPDH
jgi:hypothetical protein